MNMTIIEINDFKDLNAMVSKGNLLPTPKS